MVKAGVQALAQHGKRLETLHLQVRYQSSRTVSIRGDLKVACIQRSTAYRRRRKSPALADAWDSALDDGLDRLEVMAFRLAPGGDGQMVRWLLEKFGPKCTECGWMTPTPISRFVSC